MDRYTAVLEGLNPIILHADNLAFTEKIKAWQIDPANKEASEKNKGDDRSPAWTWMGYLYHDTKHIGVPSDNLMTMFREGGAKVKTGNKKETYKKQTQSGILIDQQQWDILVNGKKIPVEPLNALIGCNDFARHIEVVQSLGFDLMVKRVRIGNAKHVRVRPIFRNWRLEGTFTVLDEELSGLRKDVLATVLNQAGGLCGLGDWRPSSPKSPGSFGTFKPTITKM